MAFLSQIQTIPSAGPPNPLTTPTKQFKEWTTSEEIRKWKTKHNFLLSVDLLHTNTHKILFPLGDVIPDWCLQSIYINEDTTFLLSRLLLLCINHHFPTPLTFRKTHNLNNLIRIFFNFFSLHLWFLTFARLRSADKGAFTSLIICMLCTVPRCTPE